MKRVLIVNRGEISVRITKTLRNLGIESVAIYHADEKQSEHVLQADKAVCLGSGSLTDTYLNIPKLISIAKDYKCDAVHPGYGFLSENSGFAHACEANNITFIGPKASVIQAMAIKSEAKLIAKAANVPVLEGTPVSNIEEARDLLEGYPVLIKAVAGGGGKGLKIVRKQEDFESAFNSAQREAVQYFSNGELMLEPYIEEARHIEVQVFGDEDGNVVHLFERECSIQRNYQKVIEEAPAYNLSVKLRNDLHEAAIRFAKQLNYTNAGTVEFLVKNERFWFLEMNTRIQVEHPVTEMVTGMDVVAEQIRIAQGKRLSENFNNLELNGHSIEARVYSEAPFDGFRPSIGKILFNSFPDFCRVDSFIKPGTEITPHFDSMLAKVIVHEENRESAIQRLLKALNDTVILGVDTNINYLEEVASIKEFKINNISTTFLNNKYDELKCWHQKRKNDLKPMQLIPAFILNEFVLPDVSSETLWHKIGRRYLNHALQINIDDKAYSLMLTRNSNTSFDFVCENENYEVELVNMSNNKISYTINNKLVDCYHAEGEEYDYYYYGSHVFKVMSPEVLRMAHFFLRKNADKQSGNVNQILSPLFGKVVNVNVKKSDKVKKGQVLVTIESMKTENHILAPGEGIVDSIKVKKGIQVKENNELLTLSPIN